MALKVVRRYAEVVRRLARAGIRQRNHPLQCQSRLAHAVFGYHVIRERSAAFACAVACLRIENRSQTSEVPIANLRRRNAQQTIAALRSRTSFPGRKEEQFVVFDGTAKGAAELIVDALRRVGTGRSVWIEEQVLGAPKVIGVVLERHSMPLVRSRFCDHRYRRPARHALLSVEIVGRDVHGLDRFQRRDIIGVVRKPGENARRSVDSGIVRISGSAVDVRGQRPCRGVGGGVLELRRCGAGNQVEQRLEVAVTGHGNVCQLLGGDVGVQIGFVSLQLHHFRAHHDALGHTADLQWSVHAHNVVRLNLDTLGLERCEACRRNLDVVDARRYVRDFVRAAVIRLGFHGVTGRVVFDGYSSANNGGLLRIANRSDQGPIQNLSNQYAGGQK